MIPNFFIVGAPKCGTTSLATWIGQHPKVFVTNPKEPRFFNTDYNLPNRPGSVREYESLFLGAADCTAIGEGTTGYLASCEAITAINHYNPDAKFIVCLRNPVEMAPSLHGQRLKEGVETESRFDRAWALQQQREKGHRIPLLCPDAKILLYGYLCCLGEQVERLLQVVDRDRVLFVFLEDMKTDPGKEYCRVLSFLGVRDDGRQEFPVENVGAVPRALIVAQLARGFTRLRQMARIHCGTGLRPWINNLNRRPGRLDIVGEEMRLELNRFFQDDVLKLGDLVGRDLTHWRSEKS